MDSEHIVTLTGIWEFMFKAGFAVVILGFAWMIQAAGRKGEYSDIDMRVFIWTSCGGFGLVLASIIHAGATGQIT